MLDQIEKTWFDPTDASDAPSDDLKRIWCDYKDQNNPFSKYIGNEHAVKRLCRSAFTAFGRYNRCCRDQNFAFLGPASTGKTTLAKMEAELLDIPFVEISPRSIKTLSDLFVQIAKVLENTVVNDWETDEPLTLELQEINEGEFILPPCIVFIDEVHSLRDNIVQGLLKATESKDCLLVTENGWKINTYNVAWRIATTDRGLLFDAFDTRFTKINLRLYSLSEIAQIIKLNNPDWTEAVCDLVALYGGRVPREALAFAREMRMEYEMYGGDWKMVAKTVAEDNGIDPFGMTYQRLEILTALGQGPIARGRMSDVAQCKEEELVKFIMPPVMAKTPDQNPLVVVTSKGYTLTEDGVEELKKRGIPCKKGF